MRPFQRQIGKRVITAHGLLILMVFIVPALRGCFKPRPKEIVTFIEFGAPAPEVSVAPVERLEEVAPPAPAPEPAPVPEPVKPKPTPKPTPKPKPVPKKVEPEKPKWKPVDPKDIKKGKKIVEKPTKPAISSTEITKALSDIQSPSTELRPTGNPDENRAYISRISHYFDQLWVQPSSASSALATVVRIHITKSGAITRRSKITGSGDTAFDRSVMDVVESVNSVPKPPSSFPYDYVEVEFRIRN